MADQFAKYGLFMKESKESFTSISHLRRRAREQDISNWKANWDEEATRHTNGQHSVGIGQLYQSMVNYDPRISRKPDLLDLPKKHQSAFIQLKTGVGYLKIYFKCIECSEDDRCFGRCSAKQNTKHLVLECKRYSKERRLMGIVLEEARLSVSL